jgi:hypothetical protein
LIFVALPNGKDFGNRRFLPAQTKPNALEPEKRDRHFNVFRLDEFTGACAKPIDSLQPLFLN